MVNLVPDSKHHNVIKMVAAFVAVSWVILHGQLTLAADLPEAEAMLEESAVAISARLGTQMSLFEEQIAALETEFGPYHYALLEPLQGLTTLLIDAGNFAGAGRILNRRLHLLHTVEGPTSLNQLPLLAELISNDVRLQRWQSVTERFEFIRSLHMQNPDVDTSALLNSMNDLSTWYLTYMFIDKLSNRKQHLDASTLNYWKMISLSETRLVEDSRARISRLYGYALERYRLFDLYWAASSNALAPSNSSYSPEFHGAAGYLRDALRIVNHILNVSRTMDDPEAEAMAMMYVADFRLLSGEGSATSSYQSAEEKLKDAGIDERRIEAFFSRAVVLPVAQFHFSLDDAITQQTASGYSAVPGAEAAEDAYHLVDFVAWNELAPTSRLPALPEPASAAKMELNSVQLQFSINSRGKSRDAKAVEATTDSARVRGHAQNAVKAMQFRPKFARRGGQRIDDVMMNYLYPLER